jgi:hypothetical protein
MYTVSAANEDEVPSHVVDSIVKVNWWWLDQLGLVT